MRSLTPEAAEDVARWSSVLRGSAADRSGQSPDHCVRHGRGRWRSTKVITGPTTAIRVAPGPGRETYLRIAASATHASPIVAAELPDRRKAVKAE
jgi:hypothetical protein